MLSLVDNRAFIRLSFRVLEHDPTQNDIRRFLADFKARLDVRGLAVRGVTTDGSELYPEPLKELWPDVPHQVCEFHVIKEITKAVLHALAATRKKLRDRIPKQPRGRPRKAERAQSRKATRQQQQVSKLFEHRYLFVPDPTGLQVLKKCRVSGQRHFCHPTSFQLHFPRTVSLMRPGA